MGNTRHEGLEVVDFNKCLEVASKDTWCLCEVPACSWWLSCVPSCAWPLLSLPQSRAVAVSHSFLEVVSGQAGFVPRQFPLDVANRGLSAATERGVTPRTAR